MLDNGSLPSSKPASTELSSAFDTCSGAVKRPGDVLYEEVVCLLLALRICDLDRIYDAAVASNNGSPVEDPATFHTRSNGPVRPNPFIGDAYAADRSLKDRCGVIRYVATTNYNSCLPVRRTKHTSVVIDGRRIHGPKSQRRSRECW